MERIGDFAENVAEFSLTMAEKRTKFTPDAMGELKTMAEKTMETLKASLEVFEKRDESGLSAVFGA